MTVEDAETVDLIAEDADHRQVALIMVEARPWEGSEEQVDQLMTKLNRYVAFALDGELLEKVPEAAGKSLRVQLDCASPPPDELMDTVRSGLEQHNIGFTVNLIS